MTRRSTPFVAAALAVLAGCGGDAPPPPSSTPAAAGPAMCDELAYTPAPSKRFVHPSQSFYAPDTPGAPSAEDIQHLLLADNAIVISYPASAPRAIRERLRAWAPEQVATVVVPDKTAGAPPVRALIATAELRCDGVDVEQLIAFAAKRGSGAVVPHADD